jgi:hypothetical protein
MKKYVFGSRDFKRWGGKEGANVHHNYSVCQGGASHKNYALPLYHCILNPCRLGDEIMCKMLILS